LLAQYLGTVALDQQRTHVIHRGEIAFNLD